MQILVLSNGRSGTNIILTALSKLKGLELSDPIENKAIFNTVGAKYKNGYLTKSDTVYTRSWLFVAMLLQNNPDMKVIWTIRHPFDQALSKINRGCERGSDDATLFGCLGDLYKAVDIHKRLITYYRDRVFTIRMEDMILNTEPIFKKMCNWLELEYVEDMLNFTNDMLSEEKKERYQNIDYTQVDMYKSIKYVNSIISKSGINIELLFNLLQPIVWYYNY